MTAPEKIHYLESLVQSLPGNSTQSQRNRLREALSRYPINTYEASRYLDIYHPPARVLQLRKAGVNIVTTREPVETESGKVHRVGRYSLIVGDAQ